MENEQKIKYSKEYWDVKNAGKRLLYKLSPMKNGKYRTIEVDESDFNALKSLLGYINRVEDKTIYNNELFAKLYIMELVGQIRENETTVFNSFIFERLSNQLGKPLDLYYKAFYDDLCANQLNRLTENNFDTKEADEIIKDRIRFEETFSLDYVKTKLNEMMNATLHRRS
jgi:hypothetical protein